MTKQSLSEDVCTVTIISRWILLRIINISDKSCTGNKTSFISSIKISEDCDFYVIMRKNIVEPDRPQRAK